MADLKQRGLLEDTLVWWAANSGEHLTRKRTAQVEIITRVASPFGWPVAVSPREERWGRTDEFGHTAIENKIHMHDLHATLLHLLGHRS